jgi:hypothetical protein
VLLAVRPGEPLPVPPPGWDVVYVEERLVVADGRGGWADGETGEPVSGGR